MDLSPTSRSCKVIAWLLVLAIGHVPVPWVHDHASLSGGELEAHLDAFHAGDEQAQSFGWHVHFFCLGLQHPVAQDGFGVDGSCDHFEFRDYLSRRLEKEKSGSRRINRKGRARPSPTEMIDRSHPLLVDTLGCCRGCVGLPHLLRTEAPLYSLYCTLLI